jgi:uncharacterized membrane protein
VHPSAERKPELDVLRGVAALLMVEQHLGIWLIDAKNYYRELTTFWVGLNMLGGFAAPLFVFLAGASAYASRARGWDASFRGLRLLALGYLLNFLVPAWFEPWTFYVLHVIGVWLILAPLVADRSKSVLAGLTALVIVLGALGQVWLRVPRNITNDWMSALRGPYGLLRLAFIEGHFPLLPWLGFALAGALSVAHFEPKRRSSGPDWLRSFWLALPWLTVGVALVPIEFRPAPSFRFPSTQPR